MPGEGIDLTFAQDYPILRPGHGLHAVQVVRTALALVVLTVIRDFLAVVIPHAPEVDVHWTSVGQIWDGEPAPQLLVTRERVSHYAKSS